MSNLSKTLWVLPAVVMLCASVVPANESVTVTRNLTSMPLAFTENQGQWDEQVSFRANAGGATMWFTRDGVYHQFTRRVPRDDADLAGPVRPGHDQFDREPDGIETMMIKATFAGANSDPVVVGEGLMGYRCNYFLGNDPSKWRTDVPNFETIVYHDLYAGIDLKLFGNGVGIEYDLIVAPGADTSQVAFRYSDSELPPGFQLSGNVVGSSEAVESKQPLGIAAGLSEVRDPALAYSTYLGGSGGEAILGVAVGHDGGAVVTGHTISADFPTENPYQTAQDTFDVFITKFSSSGSSLIYSTYLGGNDNDYGGGVALDDNGNVYVTGYTHSDDFPTENPYQTDQDTTDAFVTKLSASGNSLVFSTYLGGSGHEFGTGIAVDASSTAYVTGETDSDDFPTENPYQTDQDTTDAFVTRLTTSGNSLVYSTYLGGNQKERSNSVAVDESGAAYVTGYTLSADFPTLNPFQATLIGGMDAFVTKLSGSGNLAYSTYLGGNYGENGNGIAVDASGAAYVTGETGSDDFPTENPFQTGPINSEGTFVTKLNSSGNSLVYSTYLGGNNGHAIGEGIAVNNEGNAYVTGHTTSIIFPLENPFQPGYAGTQDATVTKLSTSGSSLVYSSYLGGGSFDYGMNIAVDNNGEAYVVGYTFSSDFPTVNAFQPASTGTPNGFVTKVTDDGGSGFCDDFTGLFCDDFEDGVISDWQVLAGSCEWSETNGILSTSDPCPEPCTEQWCIQTVGDQSWTNYVLEAKVRGNSGVDKVLLFRVQDANNYYAVNLRSDYPSPGIDQLTFDKMVDGTYNADIVTADYPSENGVWYTLKVACADNSFQVYVDDALLLQHTDNDNPYYTGGIGVACWTGFHGDCDISFDNMMVTEPFPYIVLTDATGTNVGDHITISGQVQYSDGTVFTPLAPGTIGCEDPVSLMSRMVSVDAGGSFDLTTTNPVTYPGLYDFAFGANFDDMVVFQHLFIPISEPPDPIHPSVQTGLEIGVGTAKTYPETNRAISVQFPLVSSWELFSSGATEFYQIGKTAWQRTTTSPTGKIVTGLRNQAFDDCSWSFSDWGGCMLGVDYSALQVIQASQPFSLMSAAFANTWDRLRDDGHLSQSDVDGLNTYMDFAGVVQGIYKVNLTKSITHGLQAAQQLSNTLLTNSKILIKKIGLKDGDIDELLVQVEDDSGNIYVVYLHPKWENMTRVSSWCPVDLVVTNPDGLVVSKTVNEIPGAEYIEADFDNDGELEDQILIPDTSFGLYQIEVIAEAGAADTDSFSLYVSNSYWTEGIALVEHGLIGDIPPVPYTCSTFVNQQPAAFDLIAPNGVEFYGSTPIPFSWGNTFDPNPDHTTLFDLIIAPDSLFIDTVVLYHQTDTALLYSDALPTDSLDDQYFWKIRAHDLWGASTFSDQTYSFVVSFVCGDIDGNGSSTVDIADLVYLVDYMFNGGPPPPIMDAADVDGSGGSIDISDLVYLVDYMFVGGPPPACP